MDFLFFHKKRVCHSQSLIKVTKQLDKRYDTNNATLARFYSHAEVVQYLVCLPVGAFKALILSGMLLIRVFQNLLIFSL